MIAPAFAAAVMLTAELPREPDEVLEISGMYNEVMEGIEEGRFYRTEVEINPDDLPYPAVGRYQAWIVLYWNAEAGDRWLLLAEYTGEVAAHSEYAEILYAGVYGEEEEPSFMSDGDYRGEPDLPGRLLDLFRIL